MHFLLLAIVFVAFSPSLYCNAQTIAVTSEVAVWPASPVEWVGADAVAIANSSEPVLLVGGDWLIATTNPGSRDVSPEVDHVGFERRTVDGALKWRIDRSATNTAQLGPITTSGPMAVTQTGLFHVAVSGGRGRRLWTGTTDGVRLRSDEGFDGLISIL